MLILKLKVGENAVSDVSRTMLGIDTSNGDIHVAMLADDQYRVYVEGGSLPDGDDDEIFENMHDALRFAFDVATDLAEEFLIEQGESL